MDRRDVSRVFRARLTDAMERAGASRAGARATGRDRPLHPDPASLRGRGPPAPRRHGGRNRGRAQGESRLACSASARWTSSVRTSSTNPSRWRRARRSPSTSRSSSGSRRRRAPRYVPFPPPFRTSPRRGKCCGTSTGCSPRARSTALSARRATSSRVSGCRTRTWRSACRFRGSRTLRTGEGSGGRSPRRRGRGRSSGCWKWWRSSIRGSASTSSTPSPTTPRRTPSSAAGGVALYAGQVFLVFNTAEHLSVLNRHFDDLIRAAVVSSTEIGGFLRDLRAKVRDPD